MNLTNEWRNFRLTFCALSTRRAPLFPSILQNFSILRSILGFFAFVASETKNEIF